MTDWIKLCDAIASKGLTEKSLSVAIGHSHGWLHIQRKRNSEFKIKDVEAMSRALSLSPVEIKSIFFARRVDGTST